MTCRRKLVFERDVARRTLNRGGLAGIAASKIGQGVRKAGQHDIATFFRDGDHAGSLDRANSPIGGWGGDRLVQTTNKPAPQSSTPVVMNRKKAWLPYAMTRTPTNAPIIAPIRPTPTAVPIPVALMLGG